MAEEDEDLMVGAVIIAQTLAEVQAELRRFRRESETWPAFDRAHGVLKAMEQAAGDPVEGWME